MDDSVNYEMKKRVFGPRDRLSELPNSLIFEIFWLLPMKDVVQTTVLSSRWKNLWTTSPYLKFNEEDGRGDFSKWPLLFWSGTRILKLKINLAGRDSCGGVYSWVRFAKERGVQELYLHLDMKDEDELWEPHCLYSCSSLKELSLCHFNVGVNGNVNWNQLKRLMIGGVGSNISERAIQQILSGSPRLEELNMYVMENDENLSMLIESGSLKTLRIDKYFDNRNDHDPSMDTELRICTPKLEELEITGAPYSKCLLINVSSSLTRVTLGFDRTDCKDHHLICWDDVLGKTLSQILPTIQHVARVKLSDWCIKVIRDMINKMLVPLPDVKLLQIYRVISENTKK